MIRALFLVSAATARILDLENELRPILTNLADFDPDMMPFLKEVVETEYEENKQKISLLQTQTPPDLGAAIEKAAKAGDIQAVIASLAPVLSHVKSQDKEKFGSIVKMIDGLGDKKPLVQPPKTTMPVIQHPEDTAHGAFLQIVSTKSLQSRLRDLSPVFQRIRAMEVENFDHLNQLLAVQDGAEFLQVQPNEKRIPSEVEKLQEVVGSMHNLDPQAATLLSGLMDLMKKNEGSHAITKIASFLQEDPLVEEQRLNRLKPILLKLQKLDGKTFGGLAKLVGVAKDTAAKKLV